MKGEGGPGKGKVERKGKVGNRKGEVGAGRGRGKGEEEGETRKRKG
jgi:hypothetical protein